jgi:RNA polymerase II subunit A small phosphatase-like protein
METESTKKTIALDIDGTLFYTSKQPISTGNIMESENNTFWCIARPNLNQLFDYLDSNKEHFEIIVYSAGKKDYVEKLLNFIEKRHLITEVYAREYCDTVFMNGKFRRVKNYKNIKKNLHNLYLIDDTDAHFDTYDVIGYKCKKFKGEPDDNEILNIIDFLEMLKVI